MEEDPPAEEATLPRAENREAMTYQRYLAEEGIEARLFSANQDAALVFGESTLEEASVIVLSKYRKPALVCMKTRSIRGDQVLFQCECCSALNRFDNDGCANCGGR